MQFVVEPKLVQSVKTGEAGGHPRPSPVRQQSSVMWTTVAS